MPRAWTLRSRPEGLPAKEDFELVEQDLPPPGEGELRITNHWLSVDPYMRGRMNEAKSYVEPFRLGEPMEGGAVGKVVESKAAGFSQGDLVFHMAGWREEAVLPARAARKLPELGVPDQQWLGNLGLTGGTAYFGLLQVAEAKKDDLVFVSAAAGAVGSAVVQIAKAEGMKVIGSAGGEQKCAFVREIGADRVIDYKAGPIAEALGRAVEKLGAPGIDVYFDNVGGDHLDAAFAHAADHARFAICGMIEDYNRGSEHRFRYIMRIIAARIRLQGFLYPDFLDRLDAFYRDMGGWVAQGKVVARETVHDGIEAMPEAFIGLFRGENIGKMLVRIER
ncbi:MAG: NADP-dependent oxidoreductase [Sphingomonadaceae bacterium]